MLKFGIDMILPMQATGLPMSAWGVFLFLENTELQSGSLAPGDRRGKCGNNLQNQNKLHVFGEYKDSFDALNAVGYRKE